MLEKFKRNRESVVDKSIDKVLSSMDEFGPDSKEYAELINHLERLTDMKAKESQNRVSPDTMAIVGGNLLGILIIVIYEQKHIMRSAALNLILKKNPR